MSDNKVMPFNQKGYSVLETVIVAGISGFIMMSSMAVITNQFQSLKHVDRKFEVNSFRTNLINSLYDKENCTSILAEVEIAHLDKRQKLKKLRVKDSKDSKGKIDLVDLTTVQGQRVQNTDVKITNMIFQKNEKSLDPRDYEIEFELEVPKGGTPLKSFKLPISVATNGANITDCVAQGAGNSNGPGDIISCQQGEIIMSDGVGSYDCVSVGELLASLASSCPAGFPRDSDKCRR